MRTNYTVPIILIASIVLGGLVGHFFDKSIFYLKPIGAIFLNLLFIAIVPLIFFSIAAVIARTSSLAKLGSIIFYMSLVFVLTGLVAAIYALVIVKLFPPAQDVLINMSMPATMPEADILSHISGIFTVSEFYKLFSHKHMLALIVFSIVTGLAASQSKEKGLAFVAFLEAGEEVFMRVFNLIMWIAPIGFFAYFAVLVSELGPQLMENYVRISIVYYLCAIVYFIVAYSLFAYLAGSTKGLKLFWKNIFLPTVTSIATCSSAASIPANLLATKNMQVPPAIYETAVPLGAIIHKDGSVIGGIFKIAFLFGIFQLPFSGFSVILTAIGVALLVGTVMGAIPSGGMLGELLILSVYGFPPSVLMAIAAISIIIDPIATMLNVTGNSVSSMMIARLVEGKAWLEKKPLIPVKTGS